MQSLNKPLLLNIIQLLPIEDKFHLKLVDRKFNNLIDLTKDHKDWKLNKAEAAIQPMYYVSVFGDNILARLVLITPLENEDDEDCPMQVCTRTISVKNVNWSKLSRGTVMKAIRDRKSFDAFESLTYIDDECETRDGFAFVRKRVVEVK